MTLSFDTKIYAFADDVKIVGSDPSLIQSDLNKVIDWCNSNYMALNFNKVFVLYFGNKNQIHPYFIKESKIAISERERDLGIFVNNTLNLHPILEKFVRDVLALLIVCFDF